MNKKTSLLLVIFSLVSNQVFATPDCNLNGISDSVDISSKTSQDCNANSIPDECDTSASGFSFGEIREIPIKQQTLFGFVQSELFIPTRVADFNGDGKPDLWGRSTYGGYSGYNYIFVYLNNGDNTYGAPIEFQYSGSTGFSIVSISGEASQDVDNDGDLDIIFRQDTNNWRLPSPQRSYQINVLVNDGHGNFTQQPTNIPSIIPVGEYYSYLPNSLVPASLATATSKDLVMMHEGRVYALYNTGNLTYLPFDMGPSGVATKLKFLPNSKNFSQTYVFGLKGSEGYVNGRGDGSLVRENFVSPTGYQDITSIERIDSLNTTSTVTYRMIPGKPADSNFKGSSVVEVPRLMGGFTYYPVGVGSVEQFQEPVDFNGDSKLDLVLFGPRGGQILLNSSEYNIGFDSRLNLFYPSTLKRPLLVYDFDNDGKLDVLFESSTAGKIAIAFNNTTYPLVAPIELDEDANNVPDSCQKATPGDFDGDKRGDRVVVRNYSGNYLWLIRNSTQNQYITNNIPLGQVGDTLLAGDYDGDGKVDPGVVSTFGNGLLWKTTGADLNTSQIEFGLAGDFPLTGHFNSDKKLDRVVVRNYLGNLQWFINTDGQNNSVQSSHLFGLTGDIPYTGDIDGDGISDLVVSRVLSSGQMVWYALSLDSKIVTGPFPWGLRGDKTFAPQDIDGDGADNYLVARGIGGFLNTFNNSPRDLPSGTYPIYQKLFGLVGDDLHLGYNLRLPFPQLAVRRYYPGQTLANYYDSVAESAAVDFFGFPGDIVIGLDGKAVN